MKLNLVKETNPILFKECEDFNFENPQTDPIELAKDLNETMIYNKGLGLSANQVGLSCKVFVVRVEDETPCAFFNPRIVDISENKVSMQEGCLSFPLLFLKVKRPDAVKIRYEDENGNTMTNTFTGMTARVVLHEYDHLKGQVFTNVAHKFESERGLRKRMILKRKLKK
tara:strand:- start:1286 stop:1792 length:507 start_codon:yes stop_codon:yes gene_type:complete